MTLYVTFEHIWLAIGHRTQITLIVASEHIWLATIAEAIGLYLPMQLIILHLQKKQQSSRYRRIAAFLAL
ncbi:MULTISPECIES: hypothetical protein [Paenibacillus]|uniref:hypothetical protein n=1 Tax=Paenibacillus TaxID=44249 RepID=UPI00096DCB97|nr:hypothetical protein [Paenibacillus odorifer]